MQWGVRFGCALVTAWAMGCSNQVETAPNGGLDSSTGDRAVASASNGASTGASGAADACTTAANWQGQTLRFDTSESPRAFADAMNGLLKAQTEPAISVTNYMAPHCVWMVAFSAIDKAGANPDAYGPTYVDHSATYTQMFRHPAGLWTAAPQAMGWIHIVDAASKTVWIPLANVTGSASFGANDCSTLSTAEASAVIPRSAAGLAITTADGTTTTLGDLLGKKSSIDGWDIGFSFSADLAR
jgi:hypothetical protein